ncbi:MAG: Lrp/AsnC family transcriptional regulator [Candidatus Thorarchaeota archaeon]|jgi:Lrp/AsnC family transcriptional regulator for asnA, asnC and gidA
MTEKSVGSIDKTDEKILNLLQLNARMTIKEIAKAVDKGISTVHNRMKVLEKEKVITGYTAVLDGRKIGRPTLSLVLVRIRYRVPGRRDVISQREFCLEIAEHPFVQSVHVLSGEWDVLLKVRTHDVDEMNKFIVDFLRQLPAVDRTLTMFVMDTYLDTTQIRIGEKLPKVKK